MIYVDHIFLDFCLTLKLIVYIVIICSLISSVKLSTRHRMSFEYKMFMYNAIAYTLYCYVVSVKDLHYDCV